ncbi:phosphoribosylanthranilate isomerase [Pseudoduganella buxea]|uniref:N-(5'-phosphoribosyl)anthranilate isomerase n=1 Tax=Pseudoduganella buxea TaxID=1949069 RepID=A0A6I3SU91_9BURK|nr:phosphoribosylanthranilate isomerase [Pseudoduganella buxea]MTV52750.1 phosphoribosylanthranilate isomerase [Pseudoduganella buxea]GGB85348.1 N-(5'-phosphoribosyl)anthranilate isomerase [Pseudoduganella buxea]
MQRTRIKICGLTREQDVHAAVAAGADAVGFVFYPKSPRHVTPQRAAELIALLPPFVTAVGLFVNASSEEVAATVAVAPVGLLQFHGDETVAQRAAAAAAVNRPWLSVFRVKGDTAAHELLEYETQCRASSRLFSGLLFDTHVEAYGGAGKVFDWSLIPKDLAHRAVLSGGLSVHNATGAVASVRPCAVDVSSGVEAAKGIKDAGLIAQFVAAVRSADSVEPNAASD